jgi:hypothetical protein
LAYATPVRADGKSLLFDIRIYDGDGALCEDNRGVSMKDVSGGRLQPPLRIFAPETG